MDRRITVAAGLVAVFGAGSTVLVGCGWGSSEPVPPSEPAGAVASQVGTMAAEPPAGPLPTLVAVQAHFGKEAGRPKPLPAKLVLLRTDGERWYREEVTDPDANVFHKAIPWRGGILTIGAEVAPKPATLKHWTRDGDGWKAELIWSRSWDGARFNRFRDLEIGDVTGDGKDDLVLATHDAGVVAVGTEQADGTWSFVELDPAADTFVHEIEIGDLDGDGVNEFYATPSARNKASGASQPGSVVRYDLRGDGFVRTTVVDYAESHAKEILVTDLDGDGVDELYVVREAHTEKLEGGGTERVDPVRVVRYAQGAGGWEGTVVATLDDDQTRFLVPGDVDGDGTTELVAAGYKSGLWRLEPKDDGTFDSVLIDADSGGFEHATHVADLDGDGQLEVYVAADEQKEFRRYVWNPATSSFDRSFVDVIGPAANSHITWNIQDGKL